MQAAWTLLALASCVAHGSGQLGNAPDLDPVADALKPVAPAADYARAKRYSPKVPAAARWLRMLQDMSGVTGRGDDEGFQPFWLPFPAVPRENGGGANVLVLPVPVPANGESDYTSTLARGRLTGDVNYGDAGSFFRIRTSEDKKVQENNVFRPINSQPANKPTKDDDEEENFAVNPEQQLFRPKPIESARDLVKQYQEQLNNIPDEPEDPVVFLEPEPVREPVPRPGRRGRRDDGNAAPSRAPAPPQPNFNRPLVLQGQVTVRNAQYKEPYTIWRDGDGTTRTELQGGAAVSFRVVQPHGRFKLKQVVDDRSGEREVRRCAETPAFVPNDPALQRHPALPDITPFSFAGYAQWRGQRVEVWRYEQSSNPGAPGAAPGESLVTRHELLVTRAPDNTTTPRKYTVTVESSVLGPRADKYEHQYSEVSSPPAVVLDLDPTECDVTELLRPDRPEDLARLEPLREFTGASRDPRYDAIYSTFKSSNGRQFTDPREEAVRKAVLMQSTRFLTSANRAGQPFALGSNFLSDRTGRELSFWSGVDNDVSSNRALPFPYTPAEVRKIAAELPESFDWREHGGVTPVLFQGGECKSCWAFAIAGAMEGAHFIQTKKLRGLSEQSFIDCAHPWGANGCKGTWPENAYHFAQARGVPKRKEYTPYSEKVLQCNRTVSPYVKLRGYVNVPPNDVDAMKVAIRLHAPVVVIIDFNTQNFLYYKSGVMNSSDCHKNRPHLNHAMVAVGWDTENGQTSFIVKNSWSSKWGQDGYIRISANSNTCGILSLPSYPVLDTPGDMLGNNI